MNRKSKHCEKAKWYLNGQQGGEAYIIDSFVGAMHIFVKHVISFTRRNVMKGGDWARTVTAKLCYIRLDNGGDNMILRINVLLPTSLTRGDILLSRHICLKMVKRTSRIPG
ncbi:MAG: hypothetical protein D3925_09525 [Candidatus Electrothrix sp. AR5]|nr:hypothetical protein [Candidatus Electrothrix sp. AR5]